LDYHQDEFALSYSFTRPVKQSSNVAMNAAII